MHVQLKQLTAQEFGQMVQQLASQAAAPVGSWEQVGAFMTMARDMAEGRLEIVPAKAGGEA